MSKYRYQIRSYAAPLGSLEYEIVSTYESAPEADNEFSRLYGGTTRGLNHGIVVIDDVGRTYSLDEAPEDAVAAFGENAWPIY